MLRPARRAVKPLYKETKRLLLLLLAKEEHFYDKKEKRTTREHTTLTAIGGLGENPPIKLRKIKKRRERRVR